MALAFEPVDGRVVFGCQGADDTVSINSGHRSDLFNDAVEMIFDLEEKFDIQIPVNANNPRTEFDTVGQVVKAVQQLVDEQKK